MWLHVVLALPGNECANQRNIATSVGIGVMDAELAEFATDINSAAEALSQFLFVFVRAWLPAVSCHSALRLRPGFKQQDTANRSKKQQDATAHRKNTRTHSKLQVKS